jgi:cell division protein FtsB
MSDAVSPPMGGPTSASQTRASRRARSNGRGPLQLKLSRRGWWLAAAAIVALITAGRVLIPIQSGWRVSRDLVLMDAEHRRLVAENDALEDQVKFARTPEGMDAIARQKLYVTAPGEILVNPVNRPAAAAGDNGPAPRPIQLAMADWRQDASSWAHSTWATAHRWAVDPPEVTAAREEARSKHKPKPVVDDDPQQ